MISYSLDKPIDCGRLCNDIQNLINSHNVTEPLVDKVLVISIKNIVQDIIALPPKIVHIEYDPDSLS